MFLMYTHSPLGPGQIPPVMTSPFMTGPPVSSQAPRLAARTLQPPIPSLRGDHRLSCLLLQSQAQDTQPLSAARPPVQQPGPSPQLSAQQFLYFLSHQLPIPSLRGDHSLPFWPLQSQAQDTQRPVPPQQPPVQILHPLGLRQHVQSQGSQGKHLRDLAIG